ncbi:HAD-IA family hydrolase [Streptomyces sp. BG9H]|uniref:HAD-IA family hydrolase n=1 Tax=Streptomyces anatolicus TaxID=2675858 RepID=A0ABS6YRE2_9ACTN|nr:HAD-IA family hydrolase [Streptomyces anatolicus]MBW5423994.1 HAD-IA family hydrolase [Streptomyces anatolicus]
MLDDQTERLQGLIGSVRFVLFDFDGPICRLFAHRSAEGVAKAQVRWLESRGLRGLLTADLREDPDPFVVLRAVDRRLPGSDLSAELEATLTRHEVSAVASAWPTPYADPLIRTWTAVGVRLAVTTNNAPRAVGAYLTSRGLLDCFTPHIYGRTRDLGLLKPHPHCVHRALRAISADPRTTLMIGDTPSDFMAARRAGVGFLGYARNPRKAGLLRDAGAPHMVSSLEPVLRSLRGGTRERLRDGRR